MAPVLLKQRQIEHFSEPDVGCQIIKLFYFSSIKSQALSFNLTTMHQNFKYTELKKLE
jgi:hypothetical protein